MTEVLYYSLHAVGILLSCGYVWYIAPKYQSERKRTVICVMLSCITAYVFMMVLFWIRYGVFGGQNVVRVIVFLPAIMIAWGRIFRISVSAILDMTAPIACISQTFGKIGCQVVGCCYSWWEMNYGLYNPIYHKYLFPIQLLEGLISMIIAVLLIAETLKKNAKTDGWLMPWSLVLFGSTRFFLEFLRDNEKLFAGISELALWAALMTLEGGIWLAIKYARKHSRHNAWAEKMSNNS